MLERSHVPWTMDMLNDIVSICFGILLLFLACNIFTSLRLVARQYDIKDQETIRPQIYKKKNITLLWWLSSTSEGMCVFLFICCEYICVCASQGGSSRIGHHFNKATQNYLLDCFSYAPHTIPLMAEWKHSTILYLAFPKGQLNR